MGCDIHLHVEMKTNGRWHSVDVLPPRECNWCGGRGKYEPRPNSETGVMEEPECWNCKGSGATTNAYGERNYSLFGILANVRNGFGFAGCDTGDGFKPIDDPRGLPDDASRATRDHSREWGADGHSHSWATLAELLAYDWEQVTRQRGIVSAAVFIRWLEAQKGQGRPPSYCGGISGPNIEVVDEREMRRLIMAGKVRGDVDPARVDAWSDGYKPEADGKSYYTQVQWHTKYREAVGPVWFSFLEQLAALGAGADDVRVVYWFDN